MADDIDRACDREQLDRERAIEAARQINYIAATGYCLECGEPVSDGKRWCDNFCRDDWQRWNPQA